jgi:TetR/AcrR family transcriptional regulator, transcriptional repressor for nem operon
MRYDSEHKQRTREKVLKVAAKAIRANGPHRVGVAAVMAKAGLTHGGFYAHFESKDDLIAAAIGQMFDETAARFTGENDSPDPKVRLTTYVNWYLSRSHRDAVGSGCPIPVLAPEQLRLTRAARQRFATGVESIKERLAGTLTELGHARAHEDADSLLAELVGALSLARAEPEADRSEAILKNSRRSIKARFGLESQP